MLCWWFRTHSMEIWNNVWSSFYSSQSGQIGLAADQPSKCDMVVIISLFYIVLLCCPWCCFICSYTVHMNVIVWFVDYMFLLCLSTFYMRDFSLSSSSCCSLSLSPWWISLMRMMLHTILYIHSFTQYCKFSETNRERQRENCWLLIWLRRSKQNMKKNRCRNHTNDVSVHFSIFERKMYTQSFLFIKILLCVFLFFVFFCWSYQWLCFTFMLICLIAKI